MRRHNITLSEPVSKMVQGQVAIGRYKDFSAAVQDAAWNFFAGAGNPFQEYGLEPREVEGAAKRDRAGIRRARKAGDLKAWKPGR